MSQLTNNVSANKQDMVTVGTQDLVDMFDLSHISDRPLKVTQPVLMLYLIY